MNRRSFLLSSTIVSASGLLQGQAVGTLPKSAAPSVHCEMKQLFPGIWRFRCGVPEPITPVTRRNYPLAVDGLSHLPQVAECPVTVAGERTSRGFRVSIPLGANEAMYGFGLQFHSFMQRGTKKLIRVNADPRCDSGDTHAPVPFYVTTGGYGVLIDTARYAMFYCGNQNPKGKKKAAKTAGETLAADALPVAYRERGVADLSEVIVEVPLAEGVDVYVFGGPSLCNAVQRYNLFSGGGVLPPRWGLGMWYRAKGEFTQQEVLKLADDFRAADIPCDVLGLEPGWQSHAYSCTYKWSDKFPQPTVMLQELSAKNYRLNLWEHAFTHPDAPIHDSLLPYSADYEVWQGLVPDFLSGKAREIFAAHHEQEHVSKGVSGYKLDECDNSDFTGSWSFPEISRFPSGADGEQMHSLFGLNYAKTIQSVFEQRRQRTYGLIRSAHALASPYPYVLYSDLYDHGEFIRALANSGFSGLLWSPEVRDAKSLEDLVRRLQSAVFSPMAQINGWYIANPPWKQVDRDLNNQGQFDPDWKDAEAICRQTIQLRMRFIPYLHAAFVRYKREGLPPFRAVVMDYPNDPQTWGLDDQYLVGENLMVAPVLAGQKDRSVYLPKGEWFDFWTERSFAGKQTIHVDVPLNHVPIFVKSGTLLPLAEPTSHTEDLASWSLEARVYGRGIGATLLYEDDGSFEPSLDQVKLSWDEAAGKGAVVGSTAAKAPRYQVVRWHTVLG